MNLCGLPFLPRLILCFVCTVMLQAYLGRPPSTTATATAAGASAASSDEPYPSTPRMGGGAQSTGEAVPAATAAAAGASASAYPGTVPPLDSLGIEMIQLSTELLKWASELLAPHRLKLLTLSWKYTKVWGYVWIYVWSVGLVPELLAPHRLKLLTLSWKYTEVWDSCL